MMVLGSAIYDGRLVGCLLVVLEAFIRTGFLKLNLSFYIILRCYLNSKLLSIQNSVTLPNKFSVCITPEHAMTWIKRLCDIMIYYTGMLLGFLVELTSVPFLVFFFFLSFFFPVHYFSESYATRCILTSYIPNLLKVFHHEIIDMNMEGDSGDEILINGEVHSSGKGKVIQSSANLCNHFFPTYMLFLIFIAPE